ncbi:MAG: hypothetical protein ACHQ51_15005 [Elusimicrobiota bacterium]
MKPTILILALSFAAANSSAQIMPVRFTAPVNPIMGLPKNLPSPLTGPLAGMDIHLPSLVPTLTPAPALLPAVAPQAALPVLPAALPSRGDKWSPAPANPSHENVINPLRRIMPGVTIRFGEKAKDEKTVPAPRKDTLDQLFDGDGQPVKPGMNRGPIGNERRISLPEDDLMRELGF